MSEQTERDDTILGTALSRAVESQHPRETPFERSRVAARLAAPARSAFWPALAAAATFLAAVGLAAFVLVPRGAPAEPSPSAPVVVPTNTPGATASVFVQRSLRLFFARDQLPPVGATVAVWLPPEATGVTARLQALLAAGDATTPPGATSVVTPKDPSAWLSVGATVSGDLATVRLGSPSGWNIRGAAMEAAFLQQIVYTITEEPGIRRVLLTDDNGKPFQADQTVVDKPLRREDVMGYSLLGTATSTIDFDGGERVKQEVATFGVTAAEAPPGLSRFTIRLAVAASSVPAAQRWDPAFSARLAPSDDSGGLPGKWAITLTIPDAAWPAAGPQQYSQLFEAGPIRAAKGGPIAGGGVGFTIFVDDARPWRVVDEPLSDGTSTLAIDVGGAPRQVNANLAVYAPRAGDAPGRSVTLTGAARVFEASVAWRLKDARGVEVAVGHTTASIGTSPVWGTFTTRVDVPAGVSGNVTLEVFHASPQDGSDQDLVEIPLTIR